MRTTIFAGLFFLLGLAFAVSGVVRSQDAVDTNASDRILVRYAKACVDLAEVELKRAENSEYVASPMRIEWYRANLSIARNQLEIAREIEHGTTMPLQLVYASKAAEHARKRFEAAEKSSDPKLVREEMRLRAEVARLRLELWRDADSPPSLIDQMQWQIDRLTEELIDLNHRVGELEK